MRYIKKYIKNDIRKYAGKNDRKNFRNQIEKIKYQI